MIFDDQNDFFLHMITHIQGGRSGFLSENEVKNNVSGLVFEIQLTENSSSILAKFGEKG